MRRFALPPPTCHPEAVEPSAQRTAPNEGPLHLSCPSPFKHAAALNQAPAGRHISAQGVSPGLATQLDPRAKPALSESRVITRESRTGGATTTESAPARANSPRPRTTPLTGLLIQTSMSVIRIFRQLGSGRLFTRFGPTAHHGAATVTDIASLFLLPVLTQGYCRPELRPLWAAHF